MTAPSAGGSFLIKFFTSDVPGGQNENYCYYYYYALKPEKKAIKGFGYYRLENVLI